MHRIRKQPICSLQSVTPILSKKLEKLKIFTVSDLLFHFPLRYEDRTHLWPVNTLQVGKVAQVEGKITDKRWQQGSQKVLICTLSDGQGLLCLRFFHAQYLAKRLMIGSKIRCYGEVRSGFNGIEMTHPEVEFISSTSNALPETLTPIYPTVKGVNQKQWHRVTTEGLKVLDQLSFDEWLPIDILKKYDNYSFNKALKNIHRPPLESNLDLFEQGRDISQQRLAFEELLAHHLSLRKLQQENSKRKMYAFSKSDSLIKKFIKTLPFTLTKAQESVWQEIKDSLEKSEPMLRLLQGDVGAGKTVIAALSILKSIESGFQVALMAPTEILAEQHFDTLRAWLEPLSIKVVWLTSSLTAKEKKSSINAVSTDSVKCVIGTHALFQQQVMFKNLGLVIIDEQHRFGVHQRLTLSNKGVNNAQTQPHHLVMTATPIPRTLAMCAYADLQHSIIDTLPPGRKPIQTVALPEERRAEVISKIEKKCKQGSQVYWICPLIEESEALQCQAALRTCELLSQQLPLLKVKIVHGKLASKEKQSIMAEFRAGLVDVLVATTVVEVGVDVTRANLMIIENSERLGLAQLHQLRGRVGRGEHQSYCVLMYQGPLSQRASARLTAMRKYSSGFDIAEQDLKIRGPGELLGTRQSGEASYKVAHFLRDRALIVTVKQVADGMIEQNDNAVNNLIERWLPEKIQYAQV